MLDALRNISILNHFLQNVTCSMWVLEQISPNFSLLTGLAQLSEIVPMLCVGMRPQVLCVHDLTRKAGKSLAPTRSMGVILRKP